MVNQAALKAAMDGSALVSMNHMEFARDKVLMGEESWHRHVWWGNEENLKI